MNKLTNKLFPFGIALLISSCISKMDENVGRTEVTKWQGNKQAAISITYDDGTINQFTVARPIMNRLGLPGTFYIITGKINGSAQGKFIGRPKEEIIMETATIKTNEDNFFERASLIGYTGIDNAGGYHSDAGSLFESGKIEKAYSLMDEAYALVRKYKSKPSDIDESHSNPIDSTTWEDYKIYAAEGHELASHTVTHPRLAVLDETNILYELEQSKADIEKFLGEKYTFSAECPYGTENERVMEYAHKIYLALRNRMPEPYLEELNRWNTNNPGESNKDYVQWQRGPLMNINMDVMKSWVDTCIANDNIWLVLVFHGVDGIGWEPRTGEELEEYFNYLKEREEQLWVATFADVTKYIRERKNVVITSDRNNDKISVKISSTLDKDVYNVPITLKTFIPGTWEAIELYKNNDLSNKQLLRIQKDDKGSSFVIYNVMPNDGEIILTEEDDS